MTRARMVQMTGVVPTTVEPARRVHAHKACGSRARVAEPVATRPRTAPACGHFPQPEATAEHSRNRNLPNARRLSCPTAKPAVSVTAGHGSPKERTFGVLAVFDR
ncbi:hypothetical protein EHYA_04556 [Embleya hyalina]|uniref:Uncharacterized protein n=1 Tax=Embleya hyalina TaxID=516124 RepID=A0A401YQI3_9ACTN|nr:hypothetical protein EHYA_04556 [Embleya hyalina]